MSGDHVVSDSYCRSTSKPLGSQQCTNSPCDSVVWVYGSWTVRSVAECGVVV